MRRIDEKNMREIDVRSRLRVGYELFELDKNDVFLDIGCAWDILKENCQ